jgi:hypothetical protein
MMTRFLEGTCLAVHWLMARVTAGLLAGVTLVALGTLAGTREPGPCPVTYSP